MKKEPQIFTRIDKQNVPVSLDILDSLEEEEMVESMKNKKYRLVDILFEKEERKTHMVGEDLESAFRNGPGGVRLFMDAQGNKDPEIQEILMQASAEDVVPISDATPLSVQDLGPTQQFIDLMQSVSFSLGSAAVLSDAITSKTSGAPGAISVSGNAVLDGHHRWSGVYAITPDGTINAKDFGFPGSVSEKLASAQMAVAAVNTNPQHPSKGGGAATDIIGKSKDDIIAMIDANKGMMAPGGKAPGSLLNDDMIQDIADGLYPNVTEWAGLSGDEEFVPLSNSAPGFENDPIRKGIADKVGSNLASLPSPLAGAPKSREDMPQLDHDLIGGKAGLAAIEKGLPAGEFNIVPPIARLHDPEHRVISKKESHDRDERILERWQRLAGLIRG